jgi:hypothetical protein
MKLVSSLSLSFALALGGLAVVGSGPAAAAKKEKPAAAPSFNLGKPFRAAIAPAQAAVKTGDIAGAQAKLAAADAAATNPDEKYVASAVRLELATAAKDPKMQAAAINGMIASGSTPAADLPKLNFYAGNFAYQAGDYVNASQKLGEADRLGYKDVNMYLLLAEAQFKQNKVAMGLPYVEKAIAAETAAGKKPPVDWYSRAASVSYKAKLTPETVKWTRMQVQAYPTPENWRSALVIYRDSGNLEGQIGLDLMRLMRRTGSLAGERDYYEYASAAAERGLPGEAKSVIEEGMAQGKIPKTSRALGELLTISSGKTTADRNSLASSERQAGSASTGKIAAATADAYLGYGEDAKAIALYKTALQKGGVDAEAVNTRLGIALTRSGDKAGARAAFATVKGARIEVAKFWMLYLDTSA